MPTKTPQDHPQTRNVPREDAYDRDLHPDPLAGQNIGARTTSERPQGYRAADLKVLVRSLQGFTFDELKEIPVLAEGAPLDQGATYLDITDDQRRPFTAMGGQRVPAGRYVVPKAECPFAYWNRLLGRTDPMRTI